MKPVLEEIEKIRTVRRKICERFGDDPRRLLEHYQQLEQKLRAEGLKFADERMTKPFINGSMDG